MKLYVIDSNREKKFLDKDAQSRSELAEKLGSDLFEIAGVTYHVSQVQAERSHEGKAVSAIAGGALGFLAGPAGLLIGSAIGTYIGNEFDKTEDEKIELFNRSRHDA